MRLLRSTLFTVYLVLWTLPVGSLVVVSALMARLLSSNALFGHRMGRFWRHGVQLGFTHILGIHARIHGLENIPQEPCVILSKHQSAWETFVLQDCVPQHAYCLFVLKRELLLIPIIGWAFGALGMISINRKAASNAMEQVVAQGKDRLQRGFYVVIFPEGTRIAPGQQGRYAAGGAFLACHAGCKVVPVAHNAGELWPRRAFLKTSGTVDVYIGPAIDTTGLTVKEVNSQAQAWIEAQMRKISPHRYLQ